jgi:hypothetical protein
MFPFQLKSRFASSTPESEVSLTSYRLLRSHVSKSCISLSSVAKPPIFSPLFVLREFSAKRPMANLRLSLRNSCHHLVLR